MRIRTTVVLIGLVTALAAGLSSQSGAAQRAGTAATRLSGSLKLAAGRLSGIHYTGTYFRMLLPGKTDQYFSNPNSRAKDKTYTLMRPGTDGGLELGRFQPPPNPAFSSKGNALARRVTLPETFASIQYSISTAAVDAQSGARVSAPSLTLRGTKITGNLGAWTAEWNKIYFNQGAPKPNGSYPGLTRPVTGTYNSRTHAFTLIWYSAIVGGPFNGFTGYWHLQGTVKP